MKKCSACNGNGVQVGNQPILLIGVKFRLSFHRSKYKDLAHP